MKENTKNFCCDYCESRIFDGVYHFCSISHDEIPCDECPLDKPKENKTPPPHKPRLGDLR